MCVLTFWPVCFFKRAFKWFGWMLRLSANSFAVLMRIGVPILTCADADHAFVFLRKQSEFVDRRFQLRMILDK